MSLWGRVFAAGYDRVMTGTEHAGLSAIRHELLSEATGRVLEIGAGTGLNLAHYPAEAAELVLTEPEEPMARRLRRRVSQAGRTAQVVRVPSERLPFDDASFDSVVSTLVLCTVPDLEATLRELRRVLRPGAALLFLEHVRADDPGLARWQDRLQPLWVHIGNGCHCNRATLAAIEGAGLKVERVKHDRLPKAPAIVRPMIVGRAAAPAAG